MTVPETLIDSYRRAVYRIDAPGGEILLRVGERSDALARLFATLDVQRASFVTAWNPGSRRVPEGDNVRAQRALLQELKRRNFHWLKGAGIDPTGQWTAEPSVLVLGMQRDEARGLAQRFGQFAFVQCEADATPELVLNGA